MKRTILDRSIEPINKFLHYENSGGAVLMLAVLVAILWANSPWSEAYHHLWETEFSIGLKGSLLTYSLHHWVNDGLMAMFFFVVGLELKREIIAGELSSFKKALLPMAAALGGMIFPALIYFIINIGRTSLSGWGIPMATDIVFALALMSLAGKKLPVSAKVFLVALATIDDLGAVLVIAFFYSSNLSFESLAYGFALLSILWVANRAGVRNTLFYALIGIGGVWLAFLLSGVHATIAGVLVAFAIPARTKIDESAYSASLEVLVAEFDEEIPNQGPLMTQKQHQVIEKVKNKSAEAQTPLQKIEIALHPWVTFLVIPLFALANAGVAIGSTFFSDLLHPISIGVFAGLVLGKLTGILLFTWVLVNFRVVPLPEAVTWRHIVGIAFVAGVGFTMSLFIAALAFKDPHMIEQAKYGILLASVVSGTLGVLTLRSAE
ncbi:NhaA family Na+:H+ antiporter [Pontibacter aydingkolensis]|uniref:Na(+)/H(+) antiporter NhaA n=1 Tax=Pontibacter aydingkolensis TaxID=1911536 RepID=A0ABS7CV72_9BACT|nr:Na+/H+ antiporter NhaA [Pontibacter aydingkolensis]MBW7467768.1 Na+/H+ antiporter NhaA [Pontibacter aydingkolensis]